MKKYTMFFFVFILSFSFLIPVVSFAQTLQTDIDPTPSTSDCLSLQNNMRYRDRDASKNNEVSALQDFLQSKNYLNSEPTGYFGLLTVKAVKAFQKDNSINGTGFVGPVTRTKIKSISCSAGTVETPPIIPPITSSPAIKISVSSVGQKGGDSIFVNIGDTFTISGKPQNLNGLSYWLNAGYPPAGYYSRAYFFNQEFVNNNVCGNNGADPDSAWTMTCTAKVSGSSHFYIEIYANGKIYKSNKVNVTIKDNKTSSINVLTPNGGENWVRGTNIVTYWQDDKVSRYNVFLIGKEQYTLGKNVYSSSSNHQGSYGWTVGTTAEGIIVPDGEYTIKVCEISTNVNCDSSNGAFKISSTTNSDLNITTNSPLPHAKVGQPYSATINISGGNGSYFRTGEASFPIGGLGFTSSYGNPVYITGTPGKIYVNNIEQTIPYTTTFNMTITSGSQSVSKQFTLTVDPATTSTTL